METAQRPEVILYHFADPYLSLCARLAGQEVPEDVAKQYGCEVNYRRVQVKLDPRYNYSFSMLGISRDGSCSSAVLVGEDEEKLVLVRNEIHRRFPYIIVSGKCTPSSDASPAL